jgi:hypothetical protein
MQGTTEFHYQIANALLPQTNTVFDAAPALDTAMDMIDPQPTLVEHLVCHVLLPHALLPQIEINSDDQPASILRCLKLATSYFSEQFLRHLNDRYLRHFLLREKRPVYRAT